MTFTDFATARFDRFYSMSGLGDWQGLLHLCKIKERFGMWALKEYKDPILEHHLKWANRPSTLTPNTTTMKVHTHETNTAPRPSLARFPEAIQLRWHEIAVDFSNTERIEILKEEFPEHADILEAMRPHWLAYEA